MPRKPVLYYVLAKHRKKRDALRNVTYVLEKVEVVAETDLEQRPEWEGWSTVAGPLTLSQAKKKCRDHSKLYLVT